MGWLILRYTFLVSAAALVACGGGDGDGVDAGNADASWSGPDAPVSDAISPDAVAPDAMPPDAMPAALDCLGDPLPTTAPDPLTISGEAYNPGIPGISQDTPIDGATVEAFERGTTTNPIATTTTSGGGLFTLSAANSSETPVDAYLKAAESSYFTTYLYPPTPVATALTGVQVVMTTSSQFTLLANFASVTPDPTKGFISLVVIDCNNDPVHGAVVTTDPATTDVIYMGSGGTPDSSATATAADGIALLFNVPTGDVELRAEVMGMDLRSHTVTVNATNHNGSGEKAVMTTIIGP